jgi:hypothetical protein
VTAVVDLHDKSFASRGTSLLLSRSYMQCINQDARTEEVKIDLKIIRNLRVLIAATIVVCTGSK